MRLRLVATLVAWAAIAGTANAANVFKLMSEGPGSGLALTVIEDGPMKDFVRAEPDAGNPSQMWRFEAGHTSFSKISSTLRGLCLDVVNGGERDNFVHLATCEDFSGQFWTRGSTARANWTTFTTEFRGQQLCMDIIDRPGEAVDGMIMLMPCNGAASQNWDDKQ